MLVEAKVEEGPCQSTYSSLTTHTHTGERMVVYLHNEILNRDW